ncbi:MAG: cation:proton antiporter [Cocleimonas sp.]
MEQFHTLQPVLILLIIGIMAIAVMRPIHMSPIVGYLLAGMLVGSHGLGWIEESETTHLLAELGVVFLLFDIGLHFSLANIWDARKDILGLGPVQVILCTVGFSFLVVLIGLDIDVSIVIGATLALSSTAVVAQILADNQQSNCPVAVTTTAVLIFQDICAIFLLILAASMGEEGVSLGSIIGIAGLKALASFIVAIMLGRFVIAPFFHWVAKSKDDEIFTAMALLIVLSTAAATSLAGLSLTLGAFLAGMIISETPYRHLIQTEVKPFRGLLLGFFFITVGMALNTDVIIQQWWKIAAVAFVLILIKFLFTYLAARLLRMPKRNALQMSIMLAQGSEFAFVILAMPTVQRSMGSEYSAILIIAVAASMALTPILVKIERNFAKKQADKDWDASKSEASPRKNSNADVIIVGMGEVGKNVANALDAHNISYRGVEVDHDCFVSACASGYTVGFGDATDLRLMDTIKMSHAKTIVITFANYEIARQLAPIVMERYTDLKLMVSVANEEEKEKFDALGMLAVIQNSFPRGLDMAVAVSTEHEIAKSKISKWMKRQQEQELDATLSSSLTEKTLTIS